MYTIISPRLGTPGDPYIPAEGEHGFSLCALCLYATVKVVTREELPTDF